MMLAEFVHLTITGLLIASLLALGAVGLSLTFGVARFANVAHPDFMMLGAYGVFALAGLLLWGYLTRAVLAAAESVLANRHVLTLSCTCLSEDFADVLAVVADVARNPVFPADEIEK